MILVSISAESSTIDGTTDISTGGDYERDGRNPSFFKRTIPGPIGVVEPKVIADRIHGKYADAFKVFTGSTVRQRATDVFDVYFIHSIALISENPAGPAPILSLCSPEGTTLVDLTSTTVSAGVDTAGLMVMPPGLKFRFTSGATVGKQTLLMAMVPVVNVRDIISLVGAGVGGHPATS